LRRLDSVIGLFVFFISKTTKKNNGTVKTYDEVYRRALREMKKDSFKINENAHKT